MKLLNMSFFVFVFMAACSHSPALSEEQILFGQMSDQFIAEMAKNEQMALYGSGGGMIGGEKKDKISKFSFDFGCPKLVDVEESRAHMVRCTEKLLDMVNANEKIRPFLEHYPYLVSGVRLIVQFVPFDESNPHSKKAYVHTAMLFGSKIHYRQYNPELDDDVTLLIETYEEALEAEKKRIEQMRQQNGVI